MKIKFCLNAHSEEVTGYIPNILKLLWLGHALLSVEKDLVVGNDTLGKIFVSLSNDAHFPIALNA